MGLNTAWLRAVLTVPYVPTIRVVHPDVAVDVFADVIAAPVGLLLPDDPNRRWFDRNPNTVLSVDQGPDHTSVATTCGWAHTVEVHHYGPQRPDEQIRQAARTLADEHRCRGLVAWCTREPVDRPGRCVRVMLKRFGSERADRRIRLLTDLPPAIRATWPAFAQAMAGDGFTALATYLQSDGDAAPVHVAVADRRIVGALGPQHVVPDRAGTPMNWPHYFAGRCCVI